VLMDTDSPYSKVKQSCSRDARLHALLAAWFLL
jgi:hypothetical protein